MSSNAIARIFPPKVRQSMISALVNYNGWAKRMGRDMTDQFVEGTEGDTITMDLPAEVKSSWGRVMETQPTPLRTFQIKIDMHQHIAFQTNLIDKTLRRSGGTIRGTFLERGMQVMTNKVDRHVANKLADAAPMVMGNYGPAPMTPVEFEKANEAMFELAVIDDQGRLEGGFAPGTLRKMSWGPDAGSDPGATATQYNLDRQFGYNGLAALPMGSKIPKLLRDGHYKGEISNIRLFQSNNVTKRTVGSQGGPNGAYIGSTHTSFYGNGQGNANYAYVNGANQRGNTLDTDGWAPYVWLRKGDKVVLDGVFRVNPVERIAINQNACFSLSRDCQADGNGAMTLHLIQEIITDDSFIVDPDQTNNDNHYFNERSNIRMGLEDYAGQLWDEPARTDGFPTGNPPDEPYVVSQTAKGRSLSAYRNHDRQIPDRTKIKVVGMLDEVYNINVAFHDTCGVYANPAIQESMGRPGSQNRMNLSALGFSMLMSYGEDIRTMGTFVRVDMVWGYEVILPVRTVAFYTQNESLNRLDFDS